MVGQETARDSKGDLDRGSIDQGIALLATRDFVPRAGRPEPAGVGVLPSVPRFGDCVSGLPNHEAGEGCRIGQLYRCIYARNVLQGTFQQLSLRGFNHRNWVLYPISFSIGT